MVKTPNENVRFLTASEIRDIVSCVKLNKSIPRGLALSNQRRTQTRLLHELRDIQLRPSKIEEFKNIVADKYHKSIIQPGESVGILCAQSIGEMNTQMTLNSFHHAGLSEAAVTTGVPKFQEILSATKNPKIVNYRIYFKSRPQSLEEIQEISRTKIKNINVDFLCQRIEVMPFRMPPPWVPGTENLQDRAPPLMLRCRLNARTLYENQIYPLDIIRRVEKSLSDLHAFVDPLDSLALFIYSDLRETDLQLPEADNKFKKYITEENKYEIYLDEVVEPAIKNMHVAGIPCIDEVFYEKMDTEWVIQTVGQGGANFRRILRTPGVDGQRTTSNNVWDIYETFGLEAAHQFLLDEFDDIMKGINSSHTGVIVSRMTFNGTVSSISRYTLKNECSSVLGKASFEESLENFMQAAAAGTIDTTTGTSASIVCGKKSRTGTGFMDLKIDLSMLRNLRNVRK